MYLPLQRFIFLQFMIIINFPALLSHTSLVPLPLLTHLVHMVLLPPLNRSSFIRRKETLPPAGHYPLFACHHTSSLLIVSSGSSGTFGPSGTSGSFIHRIRSAKNSKKVTLIRSGNHPSKIENLKSKIILSSFVFFE